MLALWLLLAYAAVLAYVWWPERRARDAVPPPYRLAELTVEVGHDN